LSRTTIWRLCRAGQFPKPIHPSPSTSGWIASEVIEWLAQRARNRK
jgi:predicted DNA-binding transcriptional regulator AlpA